MKLIHITATHLDKVGGVPEVLRNLVKEQNKIDGFESGLISLVAPVKDIDCEFADYITNKDLENYLKKEQPDVIIFHSFFHIEYVKAVNIVTKMKIPFFVEPHGSFGKQAMRKSYFKKVVANNTVFRKMIKKARGYIFLNNEEKENSCYRTSSDLVIPNGIGKNHKVQKKNKWNRTIYYLGRYDWIHKGLDILIESIKIIDKHCEPFKLIMWGKGDDDVINKLFEVSKELKNVEMIINEPIYGEKKNYEISELGPMILTSRYEGFPMTILEAWLAGNPCIVTPGTNVCEEIERFDIGWVTDFDSSRIAETIEKAIYEYNKRRQEYIVKCREYVLKNYTWEKIAAKSYDELRSVLSE